MAAKRPDPLIDETGEVRSPTPEDRLWAIRIADFGSISALQAFKSRRAAILKAGAAAGLAPEYFVQFEPSKPGFDARVAKALGAVLNTARHAAE